MAATAEPVSVVEAAQPVSVEIEVPAQASGTRRGSRNNALAQAGPIGVAVGVGLALSGAVIKTLFFRGQKKAKKVNAGKVLSEKSSPVGSATTTPLLKSGKPAFSFGSPVDNVMPTPKVKGKGDAGRKTQDDVSPSAAQRDQRPVAPVAPVVPVPVLSLPPPSPAPAAAPAPKEGAETKAQADKAATEAALLKQQLQMLQQMQEENAKLRAFMQEHLAASEKVTTLAAENEALKAATSKLEAELSEARKAATATPFALTSGEELQRFKGMLASRMPSTARSVCSDMENVGALGGARGDAGSVDGAATVAEFAAVTRKAAPGFFAELRSLLMMAPSAPPAPSASNYPTSNYPSNGSTASAPRTPRGTASSGGAAFEAAVSTTAAAGMGARTPRGTVGGAATPSAAPSTPRGGGRAAPEPVNVDVAQLLDTWAGGARM